LSNITGETYINALSAILKSAESSDARVSAISTFAMPFDLEGILQFLAFCHGNAQMLTNAEGEEIQGAWYGKAKMAFAQLKIKSIANPSLANEQGIFAAQQVLRHAHIQTTARHYADKRRTITAGLGALLGDVAEPGKVIAFPVPEPVTTPVAKSAKKRGAMSA
jgi:hypothetical protein